MKAWGVQIGANRTSQEVWVRIGVDTWMGYHAAQGCWCSTGEEEHVISDVHIAALLDPRHGWLVLQCQHKGSWVVWTVGGALRWCR
jgi:hypothetical protein